ncbi:hypothetical protein GASC598I20_020770 [Gilliamella apicola SCGC AB-598-I20]|nr:hypothetical protein GASC598I20_020770 [Gilliamella apicola SCGC AB-598-I20]
MVYPSLDLNIKVLPYMQKRIVLPKITINVISINLITTNIYTFFIPGDDLELITELNA